jgi:NAD(P)H-hydrate epimerase
MENAGRSAAQVAARLYPRGPVVGFVGAGNNGGDALVLLRTLAAWGREVRAVQVAERPEPESLCHGWPVPTVTDADLDAEPGAWDALFAGAGLVVDGILGTGVKGAPRERQAKVIARLNAADRPVLAIDIPSGVDSGNGRVEGEAVRADVTVSFGAPKLGSFLHPGRGLVGRQVTVEIAFPPMEGHAFAGQVVTPGWAQARLPGRDTDTHKNAVGRVLVVAGRPGMAGAAVLAGRGALRAGAGLVQVCSPPSNREILQSSVPEAIYVDPGDEASLASALEEASAVVVGPGLGTDQEAAALLGRVLAGPAVPTIMDADALNLMAAGEGSPAAAAAGRPVVVTPHLGEMTRLTGLGAEEIAADRVSVARESAEAWGCTVLLKGAPSLVARGTEPVLVDTQGSSDLAAAGMGDVLAGVVGALLAQGLDPAEAGAVALYLSGRAAALAALGPALTPGDVLARLPDALMERGQGRSDLDLPFVVFDQDAAR